MANAPHEVASVIEVAHRHALAGCWCVGFVSYEAATAFEPSCEVASEAPGPLAWFSVHEEALTIEPEPSAAPLPLVAWRSRLSREAFDERIARIHQAIADGEVYQVNLTTQLGSIFEGDPIALFEALRRAQPEAYAAFIDTGEEQVLSVSPELFFDWQAGHLLSRPMKGTAPRGRTEAEDQARLQALRESEKERAENLMIVDLIRNDVSRLAEPFSVNVASLFECRAWPTVWQMTSDVTARTRPGTALVDVFRALFPCGSVTGAPKLRAMHWIRRLEGGPRGVYCGAIGVLQPGGRATFSVAIRTVVVRGGQATCGLGSGITADASAEGEWQEWQHKRAFLDKASPPFQVLQTLRLQEGRWRALDLHLQRLREAAASFGFDLCEPQLQRTLDSILKQHALGLWRVRLLVAVDGTVSAEAFAQAETPQPVLIRLAELPIKAASPLLLRHKTTRREHYEAFAPAGDEVFDTLLWNPAGEVTEFTRGNVLALMDDGRWITPPLCCGLLDGVGRALALQGVRPEGLGPVEEAVLRVEDLPRVRELRFVNALRGEVAVQTSRNIGFGGCLGEAWNPQCS